MSDEIKQENNKEFIKEIENRLQLVITISIFFLAIISYFFKSRGADEVRVNEIVLSYGIILVFYLLNYILFEIFRLKIKEVFLKWINWSLLFGIAVFIFPISVFCARDIESSFLPADFMLRLFNYSLFALPIISFLIFLEIIFFRTLSSKKQASTQNNN